MSTESGLFQVPGDPEILQAMSQAGPAETCRYPGCTRPRYQGDAPNPYHCCQRHRRLLRISQYAMHAVSTADVSGALPLVPPEPLREDFAAGSLSEYPAVLNAPGVAELLGVSVVLILRLAREGKLPGKKVGKEWRFLRSAVLESLKPDPPVTPPGT